MRGFVVETAVRPAEGLKPVAAISMAPPVFDQALLGALQWAAHRYVAPLVVVLERAAPPNLVAGLRQEPQFDPLTIRPGKTHPLTSYGIRIAEGRREPPVAFVERWTDMTWLEAIGIPVVEGGGSVMVIAATGEEVGMIREFAARVFGDARTVGVTPDLSDAGITSAWAAAQASGKVVIGTPRVAAWRIEGLKAAIVVEEGRRAMKDRQTPTIHVRDLLRIRATSGRHNLAFVGPTPSLETLAAGASVVRASRRAWPPIEIADRNEEPPTPGVLGHKAVAAIRAVAGRGGRVFVFAHRRGYAPAVVCERCRKVRLCPACGSRPSLSPTCSRCGNVVGACADCGHERFVPLGAGVGRVAEELRRVLDQPVAVTPDRGRVAVGSEADIAGLEPVDLAVAVDPDGLILGTHFRASEEAMRILARLAGRVGSGSGRRALIQTSMPNHPVIEALRRGDPLIFLDREGEQRAQLGFPPSGELLVVEIRGQVPNGANESLQATRGEAIVMGPAQLADGRSRWLVQGADLTRFRHQLRRLVQGWRETGATVRIDADPLEL